MKKELVGVNSIYIFLNVIGWITIVVGAIFSLVYGVLSMHYGIITALLSGFLIFLAATFIGGILVALSEIIQNVHEITRNSLSTKEKY